MNRYAKALKIVNPKKSILEDKPLLAVKIVKGEYYSRPVMEKEIKEYVKKTFKKSNQYRYRKDNWLENLVEEKQIEFDRKEIEKEIKLRRLYEQMTTANMMTTLIQGEGETDIESVDGSVAASYSPLSGESSAFDNTAITSNGTGSGEDGGFDVGQDYLAFNGVGSPRYAALDAIDSTEVDTIVITAIRGNDTNGGEDPDAADEDLTVWYQIGDATPVKIGIIIPVGSDDSGLKNWSLTIPAAAQNAATKFILRQETHHGAGYDNYGVTDIKFQRRAPMNVVVSLDSPEASAFIRTGGGGTTEKDKKKKVQDILDGSDAYLENQFGEDFPGTSPREVGQEEPQPGIGKFEPEVIDYETWKNELENSDDPEAKKILKGDPKKTFNAFVDDNPELAAQSVLNDLLKGKSVKDQLSHLPQEVQDIIISQATESLLLDLSQGASLESVKDQLSQLPQETQDMITSHPLYMTDERIEEIVKDDKMFGDTMQSMWEKDEKLFNSAIDEVNEYPEHQKLNELQNTVYGFKGKDDEGYVPFTWKYSDGSTEDRSHLVLSNMSPLLYDRWAPYHELALKYYGTSDYEGSRYQTQTNVPNDYVFNHGYWYKDPVDASNEHDMPIGAPGSALRKISQPFLDAYKVHYDYDEKWGDYIKAGAQKYKDGPKFDGGEVNDPGWEKWQKIEKEAFDLWSKYREEEKKLTPQRQRMEKEIENLNKKLEAEYDKKREQIEKEMEPLMSLLHRDFIKLFTLQYFENKYGHKVPSDDSKPWSMDIQRSKDLGGSAGEIAGVDAATAASVAAQTQRDKDKGNKGGNIPGSNLTAAKEQELLQLAKMIDRKGTNVAGVGVAAGMIAAPLAQQVTAWIAAGLSSAYIMNMIKSQSGSSSDTDIRWRDDPRSPYGKDQAGPETSGEALPGAKPLTPQQQAEVDAANKELKDARTALDNLPPTASDSQRERAEERLDRANKNRVRIRKKNRTDNRSRNENYKPQGNPLMEKKKFDAVEPKEHKRSGMRIKSPQQFFNPADVKPEYPKDPPPEMINGWHPKLADGQEIANRFNKLDPQSAKAMPKTGNPHIDAKVEKAKNNPDKDGPAYRQSVFAKIKKARG